MREIDTKQISQKIAEALPIICSDLPQDVKDKLNIAWQNESNSRAKKILGQIIENYQVGLAGQIPICQDTGIVVVFANIGEQVLLTNSLTNAINQGVEQGYHNLRKSVVADPLFNRQNTGNNLPAIIHYEIVAGDQLEIFILPKGGGAENTSAIKMLSPAAGLAGLRQFVLETIKNNAVNACPPIVIGVGLGGNFETAPYLAKKALLRDLADRHPLTEYACLEEELLQEINQLNIGPAGLGGDTTALAVKIATYPCHIASLPVAINIQCHSARHGKLVF